MFLSQLVILRMRRSSPLINKSENVMKKWKELSFKGKVWRICWGWFVIMFAIMMIYDQAYKNLDPEGYQQAAAERKKREAEQQKQRDLKEKQRQQKAAADALLRVRREIANNPISKVSFQEIKQKRQNLTEMQYENYFKQLAGQWVIWRGRVNDVQQGTFGGIEVRIDFDGFTYDATLEMDDLYNQDGLPITDLRKNMLLSFRGEIDQVISVLGAPIVTLRKVTLLQNPVKASVPKFKILTQECVQTEKCSFDLRLDTQVSKAQINQIAHSFRQKYPNISRLFMSYYLPCMTVGHGAWATSHYNPDLKIQIMPFMVDKKKSC